MPFLIIQKIKIGRFTLLYMTILTWDPEKRDAVIERANKIGFEHPGGKTIGTWVEANGGRTFQLLDLPRDMDPMLSIKHNFAWNDIMKIESFPIIDASEMLKILASMK
jgi:hypothetical protein